MKCIVGIECGNKTSKISKIGRHGVETILSESSSREIASAVVFGRTNRLFAEVALDSIKANNTSSIIYPFRLCLGNPDSFFQTFTTNINKAVIKGEQLELVQLVASYFTYLDSLIMKNIGGSIQNVQNNQYGCAISTPNYFSISDKLQLLLAFQIANLPCVRLVEEHQAIAYSYLWSQKKELQEKSKRVVFIDVGETQSSCFVYNFSKLHGKLEFLISDKDLGVREIDLQIFEYLRRCSPEIFEGMNTKSALRVREGIEKARKILSGITETQICVECIIGGPAGERDLNKSISRSEIEAALSETGFILKFKEILSRLMAEIKVTEFDDIEILGGGTRIPFIQALIKAEFSRDRLGISLQTSETISRGCAIACALSGQGVSPLVKVDNYSLASSLHFTDLAEVSIILNGSFITKHQYPRDQPLPLRGNILAQLPETPSTNPLVVQLLYHLSNNNTNTSTILSFVNNEQNLVGNAVSIDYLIHDNGFLEIIKSATPESTFLMSSSVELLEEDVITLKQGSCEKVDVTLHNRTELIRQQINQKYVEREEQLSKNDRESQLKVECRNQLEQLTNETQYFIKEELRFYKSERDLSELNQLLTNQQSFLEEIVSSEEIDLAEVQSRINQVLSILTPMQNEFRNRTNSLITITSLDNLKKLEKQKFVSVRVDLSNESLSEPSGMFSVFKSSPVTKFAQSLSTITVESCFDITLSKTQISASGLSNVLECLGQIGFSQVDELKINIESNKDKSGNLLSSKAIGNLGKLKKLRILSLSLDVISSENLQHLSNTLSLLPSLVKFTLIVKEFDFLQVNISDITNSLLKRGVYVTINRFNSTGMLVH